MLAQFDLVYATEGGVPLHFDFFRPDHEESIPVVVCIHGGGWISGERSHMHEIAPMLVEQGFAAACPQYRLAPLHPYPAAVDDVQSFVKFLRSESERFKIDPTRIGSLGISAGAHLALMLGLADSLHLEGDPKATKVQAVVDVCGITDLTDPEANHHQISHSFLYQFMVKPYSENEQVYREASPLFHVSHDDPPVLVIHGVDDDVVRVEQSDALVAALTNAGVPVEYHRLENEMHAFSMPAWERMSEWIIKFLNERLK